MVKQASNVKKASGPDAVQEMPIWARKLIEKFDLYSTSMQRSLTDAIDRILRQISDLHHVQDSILARLSELGNKLSSDPLLTHQTQQNLIYSTFIKLRANGQKTDDKLKRITWVGIDEKANEESTRRSIEKFQRKKLTPQVIAIWFEFEAGRITSHRHPVGDPRIPGVRGRIIKLSLPIQLMDCLLAHMSSDRQGLTKQYVHSYARRDYTPEELQLDRTLRKQESDLNARECKLIYVVRDFDNVELRTSREIPRRALSNLTTNTSTTRKPIRITTRSQSLLYMPSQSTFFSQEIASNFTQIPAGSSFLEA